MDKKKMLSKTERGGGKCKLAACGIFLLIFTTIVFTGCGQTVQKETTIVNELVENNAFMIVPDYESMDTENNYISTNEGVWTVEDDGFVQCEVRSEGSVCRIIINGKEVAQSFGGGFLPVNTVTGVYQVKKGDTVRLEVGLASLFISSFCYFIPPLIVPIDLSEI